jgi:ribosomal protein S18 acetylase RimI-like enzyme
MIKSALPPGTSSIKLLMDLAIVNAETAEQTAAARELMVEYAQTLGFELCFQNFDQEMRALPGKYAPPAGRLLLAYSSGAAAGVVAMRPLDDPGVCEMKRLYVRPAFRGLSLGRALAERLIAEAAAAGYTRMRLDTVPGKMDSAIALYRELGFRQIDAYYPTPVRETLFLELELTAAASVTRPRQE